ncbi:hypothetical protein T439DRAFT_219924 [Meredithblackwellia eburnea MCA 4105]
MSNIHYRSLSRELQSRESFSGVDATSGLRSRGSKTWDNNSKQGLPAGLPGVQQRLVLPRSYRQLRTVAYAGWTLAAVLFAALIISNSTMVNVPKVDLSRIPVAFGSGSRQGYGAELEPVPKGGVQSRVTLVSGFYKVESGKKHSVSDYNKWLGNFLRTVELPIVFFCAPSQRAFIAELRGNKPITIISNYETPFEMEPLVNLGGRDWAISQHKIDPENHVHVPDVYGVWTAKPWIVRQATEMDPYLSEYFFWVDAGGFRDSSVTHSFIGLSDKLDDIYQKVPDDTLVLSSTTLPFEKGTEFVKGAKLNGVMDRADRLQGGWYGGKKSGIEWWETETKKVTTIQAGLQRFSAKEQPVWTHAARLNWQKIYVQNMAWREGDCGPDMWFGFEYFADGRDCRIPAWVGPYYARLESRGRNQWNETVGVKGLGKVSG